MKYGALQNDGAEKEKGKKCIHTKEYRVYGCKYVYVHTYIYVYM